MENNRVLDKVKFLSESRGEESLNYFKFRKLLPFKHELILALLLIPKGLIVHKNWWR